MKPLPFTWPYWVAFWLVFLWAFLPEFGIVHRSQKGASRPDSQDAGSMTLLLLIQMGGLAGAFALSFWPTASLQGPWRMVGFWAGLAILAAGSVLRRHCWKLLGRHFTGDVRAEAGQRVVTSGPYAWVRHPAYSGGILMFTGIGVALGSWASIAVLIVAAFTSYIYRIRVEERALLTVLGDEYRAFMETTPKRIVPFIY